MYKLDKQKTVPRRKTLVVMRQVDGHKNNGMTRTAFSYGHRHFRIVKHFIGVLLCRRSFFGFDKPELAIANLAQWYFAKNKQNTIKLNSYRTQIGVLCTLGGHLAPLSQKPKPQAFGIFSFIKINFLKAKFGFP